MSAARRLLLTATLAGTLLCALWFVPSANAADRRERPPAADDGRLAETGGRETVPYLLGGTAFLAVGASFVVLAMRRRGRAS